MKKYLVCNAASTWCGLILTPLRICMGWQIFSAGWRRLVLHPESLNVLSPDYEGLKFNHFIPSSIGITSMIKYLVLHPYLLHIFLWVFTFVEGLIGIALILGLFTRLVSFLSFCLLLGILLGAGWLGTTCLDEWMIGVFGTASSIVLFLGGGGILSLDAYLCNTCGYFQGRWWGFFTSGPLFTQEERVKTYRLTIILSLFAIALALVTNQLNVGGVLGPFENKAVKPHLTLSNVSLSPNGDLRLRVFRDAGPDTYGSFIVSVRVLNEHEKEVLNFNSSYLGTLSADHIHNHYLEKLDPNGLSLIVPLGALSDIELIPSKPQSLPSGNYTVEVIDIDGSAWSVPVGVH